MKKTIVMICAALFAVMACQKQPVENPAVQGNTPIKFNLSATHPGAGTKAAIKTGWENGDAIFVFFSGATVPKYLKMTYNGSAWTSQEYNGTEPTVGALSGIGTSGTMRAIYLPFGADATVVADGDKFKFSKGTCSYYLTATQSYTVDNGSISGTFSMALPDGFMLFYYEDASAADNKAALSVSDFIPTAIGSITPFTLAINEISLAEGSVMPGYAYGSGYLFSGVCKASARNVAHAFDLLLSNGLTYTAAKSAATTTINPVAGQQRTINITNMNASGATTWAETTKPQIVDLGLSVKWASRPLGASNGNAYGYYYAWGETAPYHKAAHAQEIGEMSDASKWEDGKSNGYAWASYSFYHNGENPPTVNKYCPTGKTEYWMGGSGTPDNKLVLETANDAAQQSSATIGTGWRMPTSEELNALVATKTNAAYTWRWCDGSGTKQYRGSDVKGLEIKNNATGATLFLPAANTRTGKTFDGVGTNGFYWSSSLYEDKPHRAYYYYFSKLSSDISASVKDDRPRCDGCSICPVR